MMKQCPGMVAKDHRATTAKILVFICSFLFVIALAISFPGAVPASAANAGDPNRGKELFEKRCGGCHSLDADKEGPRLRNVYGRNSGTIGTFQYSNAVKSARVTWDASALDRWLISTEAVIPDNDMDFQVPKADERADIIEYLRQTAGK